MEFQGRLRHRRRWGVWLCGASCLFVSATNFAFRKKPKEPLEAPLSEIPVVEVEHMIWSLLKEPQVLAALGIAVVLLLSWCRHRSVQASRRLRRPYQLTEDLSSLKDADLASLQKQLETAILWLQETVLLPIDRRLPGRPFEFDLAIFPCKPTVLMIGNHSSGKSTFINRMMGVQVQETGVAPTDDGFTILERSEEFEQFEDGPTITGCAENKAFRELQRFGRSFLGHCRRKKMVLPKDAELPYGLQLVDTPGMIDLPGNNQTSSKARGYNFVEVVRWWAKRSDLILLLFDPDKPGTTGETLEVLTKSLAGLDHKFLVVLNKVDQLDNNVDFARAFGTLGWALSKVIPQKDIPMVWTMYNERNGPRNGSKRPPHENELPLEAFAANRNAVVREVLRAKVRHWDNIVTALEECLRQCDMLSRMCNMVRENAQQQICKAWRGAGIMLTLPWLLVAFLWRGDLLMGGSGWQTEEGGNSFMIQAFVLCCLLCLIVLGLTLEQLRQFDRIQLSRAGLETMFETVYHHIFIHTGGEDLQVRWATVRPLLEAMLKSVKNPTQLPVIEPWELTRIHDVLEQDIWYLRQLAKRLRPLEPKMPGTDPLPTSAPAPRFRGGSAESSPSPTGQGTMHGSLATHGSLAEAAKVQHEKSKDDKVSSSSAFLVSPS